MKLIILIFFCTPLLGMAQTVVMPVDQVSGLIMFEEVVTAEGSSKDELYVRAREWFAKTYRSAQDVIQMDDKAAGKIIGKGLTKGTYSLLLQPQPFTLHHTISITVKDGRYRYEITNFEIETPADKYSPSRRLPLEGHNLVYMKGKGMGFNISKKFIEDAHSTGYRLASEIKSTLAQPATGIKSKDDF